MCLYKCLKRHIVSSREQSRPVDGGEQLCGHWAAPAVLRMGMFADVGVNYKADIP